MKSIYVNDYRRTEEKGHGSKKSRKDFEDFISKTITIVYEKVYLVIEEGLKIVRVICYLYVRNSKVINNLVSEENLLVLYLKIYNEEVRDGKGNCIVSRILV